MKVSSAGASLGFERYSAPSVPVSFSKRILVQLGRYQYFYNTPLNTTDLADSTNGFPTFNLSDEEKFTLTVNAKYTTHQRNHGSSLGNESLIGEVTCNSGISMNIAQVVGSVYGSKAGDATSSYICILILWNYHLHF